jgi:hypothetical protein
LRAVVGKRLDKDGKLKPHRRDIGIGPYPEVSLAEARAKATELRLQIRSGIDPIAINKNSLKSFMFSNYGTKHSLNVQKSLLPIKPVNSKMKSILDNGHQH